MTGELKSRYHRNDNQTECKIVLVKWEIWPSNRATLHGLISSHRYTRRQSTTEMIKRKRNIEEKECPWFLTDVNLVVCPIVFSPPGQQSPSTAWPKYWDILFLFSSLSLQVDGISYSLVSTLFLVILWKGHLGFWTSNLDAGTRRMTWRVRRSNIESYHKGD